MDLTTAEMIVEKTKLESLKARTDMFDQLDWLYNQVTVSDDLIKNLPNDSDLGQTVRELYQDKINKHAKSKD